MKNFIFCTVFFKTTAHRVFFWAKFDSEKMPSKEFLL